MRLTSTSDSRSPQVQPPAKPSAASMSSMLSSLARKGAVLLPSGRPSDDPVKTYNLLIPGDGRGRHRSGVGRAQPERPIHGDLVRYACERGWLVVDALGRTFRLTEAGALAMKRGLTPEPGQRPEVVRPLRQTPETGQGLSPVARLRQRRDGQGRAALPSLQAEAAERLACDFGQGQMQPRVSTNWERLAMGLTTDRSQGAKLGIDVADGISAAQERVRRALDEAGPEFADVLLDVCCLETGLETVEHQRGWPHRTAKIILGLALDKLAGHYGMITFGARPSGKISQWGTDDFRPKQVGPTGASLDDA